MARIAWVLALLSALIALASATSAPSFCKCTCFTNSTIIPLNPLHEQTPVSGGGRKRADALPGWTATGFSRGREALSARGNASAALAPRAGTPSCSRCNRAYCLAANLPICHNAEEKDVAALCFQRDSRKDQIIVWAFILGTLGLLGWAAAKRVVESHSAAGAQEPLLGGRPARLPAPSGFFQRVAGLFRGGRARAGSHGSRLRNPFSPTTAEPRGQYAPLTGDGTD